MESVKETNIPALQSETQQPAVSEISSASIQQETDPAERPLSELSNDELFKKLQNYKRLLDNGLIMQSEYDRLKTEIIPYL